MVNSGILADGRLICWGNNDYGEMGSNAEPKLLKEGEPKCTSEDGISNNCISHFEGKWALTEFGGVSAGKRQVGHRLKLHSLHLSVQNLSELVLKLFENDLRVHRLAA